MALQVELCVASADGVRAAIAAGADRIELCRQLECGGLTPSDELIEAAVGHCQESGMGLRILVRTKPDSFLHSAREAAALVGEIDRLMTLTKGLDAGFVSGALTESGTIDRGFVAEMRAAAGDRPLVFHRAIDVTADYERALMTALEGGIDAVLTTGSGSSVADPEGLRRAQALLGDRATVIGSGGLREGNITAVVEQAGLREVHFRAPGRTPDDTDWQAAKLITEAARRAQPRS